MVGGPAESRSYPEFYSALAGSNIINLTGRTTLPQLLKILSFSRLLVSGDSGPMHLAAALGRPTVALFGPTSPQRTGPYGTRSAVLFGRCPRGPCFRERCALGRAGCQEEIAPEAAAAAVAELISGGK
jgi:ADP-heptose:LPS heptosyltransferase